MNKLTLAALALTTLALSACGSTPPKPTEEQKEQAQVAQVEDCLTSQKMGLEWGECNVQKTIYAALPKMNRCFAKKKKFNNAGELDVNITVGKHGGVRHAIQVTNTVKSKPITACLMKQVNKLRFAAPPAGSAPNVLVPLSVKDILASPQVSPLENP